ncbi:hypothetical protein BDV27DRAFT_37570 [Aspergillus caelatus]|uniref:Uncharacterized protein n=1 Tax=Aspergillus caelatus TaxID=61420 RepID=A0A5N6ZTE6_9EURO|nr:uncharacterized protein BDV27DRAFT_37570 [Aspergillus caelatus]KAE8360668.1 hypothetical protein BDV27DRAFT_37570 [Aspergillus caelatus]
MTCNRPEMVVSRTWVGIGALILLGVDMMLTTSRGTFCFALPWPFPFPSPPGRRGLRISTERIQRYQYVQLYKSLFLYSFELSDSGTFHSYSLSLTPPRPLSK